MKKKNKKKLKREGEREYITSSGHKERSFSNRGMNVPFNRARGEFCINAM
jgi:hypothetical protein